MKGKIVVLILIIFTIVVLAIGWFLTQDIMEKFDLEPSTSIFNGLH
ncbi:hypothetical protein [Oceanobacillus bengalensis]|nr:hypothetical protein [Oceanobacillus bengalensis]